MTHSFIMPPGELKKKVDNPNILVDLMFMPGDDDQQSKNIEILTIQQYQRDIANEQAWLDMSAHSLQDIENKIAEILKNAEPIREFITIYEDKVLIVIDCDKVTDEILDRALFMLSQLESFDVGTHQTF